MKTVIVEGVHVFTLTEYVKKRRLKYNQWRAFIVLEHSRLSIQIFHIIAFTMKNQIHFIIVVSRRVCHFSYFLLQFAWN